MLWIVIATIVLAAVWQARDAKSKFRALLANQQVLMDLVMSARRELARIQTGHEPLEQSVDVPAITFDLEHYPDAFANNLEHVSTRRREWESARRERVAEDQDWARWKALFLSPPQPYEEWRKSDEGKWHAAYRDSPRGQRALARWREAALHAVFEEDAYNYRDYGSAHLNTSRPGFAMRESARASIWAMYGGDYSSVHADFPAKAKAQAFIDAVELELTLNPPPNEEHAICVHWGFGDQAPGGPWSVVLQWSRNIGEAQLAIIEERKQAMRVEVVSGE